MNNKLDNGEIVCGFLVRKDYEGQKDFDQTYKEIIIRQRVKRVGDGDGDFIIEEYEEVKETPIKEVIESQRDSVGIEAYMRPYQMAGVDLPGVEVSDKIFDVSNFPEDPADAIKVGDAMMKTWQNLDPMLRGDAKTPEEFLNSINDERLKAYFEAKLNVGKGEKENVEK